MGMEDSEWPRLYAWLSSGHWLTARVASPGLALQCCRTPPGR